MGGWVPLRAWVGTWVHGLVPLHTWVNGWVGALACMPKVKLGTAGLPGTHKPARGKLLPATVLL